MGGDNMEEEVFIKFFQVDPIHTFKNNPFIQIQLVYLI